MPTSILSRFAVCVLVLFGAAACTHIPQGQQAIDAVTIRGASAVDESDLEDKISTEATPRFFGLFPGVVYDYEVFNASALQKDMARIERYYRAQGYYSAHARAGRVLQTKAGHVRVEIVVEEGPPTVNDVVSIKGLEGLPKAVQDAAKTAAGRALRRGKPFEEDRLQRCEDDTRKALTDGGYAYATVTRESFVDIVHHTANTVLTVTPGETAKFGPITISGMDANGPKPLRAEIPVAILRRTLDIYEGEPYSTAATDSAQQALLDLEIFSAVTVVPDLSHPETRVVPLAVRLEPAPLRQIRLGGGVEIDEIKTEVHAIGGWEDHNFLGGLRDFTVDLKPGVVLYPTRIGNLDTPNSLLPEEKLRLQLRQPGVFEARTSGFIRPEVNTFPMLLVRNPNPNDPVVGYVEAKGAVGLDRTFFKRLYASVSFNAQEEAPFLYPTRDSSELPSSRPQPVFIAYPDLLAHLDFRDDQNHPHSGVYLQNDLQIASRIFGSDVADVKIQPEIRTYIPVARKVTFATRASVGFILSSSNYGNNVQNHIFTPAADQAASTDIERTLFRGFFSGGPSSNRGFPLRSIGPHVVVPFLNPATATQQLTVNCAPSVVTDKVTMIKTIVLPTDKECGVAVGGFSLWELSNELRFGIKGPLEAATFCDMGDVGPTTKLRFQNLHLSCGLGLRYDTPVGPIRLDVGYRIQPLQVLPFPNERAAANADKTEGDPPRIGDIVPIAIAIGIGEAY